MRYWRLLLFVIVVGLVMGIGYSACHAQDRPALDLSRLSIATGLDYAWYNPSSSIADLPTRQQQEWECPLNLAYNLLATPTHKPLLSFIAGSSWGFSSHIVKTRVGVRLMLFTGGQ